MPAVIQDAADGRVLMVAYMDAEALAATLATGEVHFHSRSRDRLWRKGETSGNVLRLVDLATDCDGDALLVTVDPVGPTCHRGTRSCFDPDGAPAERDDPGVRLARDAVGDDRRAGRDRPGGLVHGALLDGGVDAVGRKVTEEATEVLLAAKDDAVAEASGADRVGHARGARRRGRDLLYHALVLLAERGRAARPRSSPRSGRAIAPERGPLGRAVRPISRRRLPIRTSSHSPAIGCGTCVRVGHARRR